MTAAVAILGQWLHDRMFLDLASIVIKRKNEKYKRSKERLAVWFRLGLALLVPPSIVHDLGLSGGPVGVGGRHRSHSHHLLVEEVLVLLEFVNMGSVVAHFHLVAVCLERVVLFVLIGHAGRWLIEALRDSVVDGLNWLIISCKLVKRLLQRRFFYFQCNHLLNAADGLFEEFWLIIYLYD